MGYLYFFVSSDGQEFKIGISQNPKRRLYQLPESIDISKSCKYKCIDTKKVEKIMHLLFEFFQINKPKGEGYTEWFSISCFEKAEKLILDHEHLVLGQREPINCKIELELELEIELERKARRQKVIDKAESKKNLLLRENNQSIEEFSSWFKNLKRDNLILGKFEDTENERSLINIVVKNNPNLTLKAPSSLLGYTLFNAKDKCCGQFSIFSTYTIDETHEYSIFQLTNLKNLGNFNDDIKRLSYFVDSVNFVEVSELEKVRYQFSNRNAGMFFKTIILQLPAFR